MNSAEQFPQFKDQDDLRLLALSRIPRCAACSRLRVLRATHESGAPLETPLPPSAEGCDTPYCAPLTARYAPAERREKPESETCHGSDRRSGAPALTAVAPVFRTA